MRKQTALFLLLSSLCFLLLGCGQSGRLYLPTETATSAQS